MRVPANRRGATFEKSDSPIGETVSSPMLMKRNAVTSQSGLDEWPPVAMEAAIITTKQRPSMAKPSAILAGVEGSRLRRASAAQTIETTGASAITKRGLIDC